MTTSKQNYLYFCSKRQSLKIKQYFVRYANLNLKVLPFKVFQLGEAGSLCFGKCHRKDGASSFLGSKRNGAVISFYNIFDHRQT